MEATKRQTAALLLCYLSKAIVSVLAVVSGLGLTVAVIVLAVNGTISVGAAIAIGVVGVPVIGTVVFWIAAALAFVPLGIAKLLDREIVSEWVDSQPVDDY